MNNYVTREEFEAFKRELTGEVEGEKVVTRHILEQTQRNGDDLAAVRSELGIMRSEFATVKSRLDHLAGDMAVMKADLGRHGRMLDVLAQDVRVLRADLPGIVGDAVREAFRKRDEGAST